MTALGITAEQCRSAFAAGDMAFYNASGCVQTQASQNLVDAKKKELATKTYLIAGGALVGVAILYFALK